MIELKEVSKIYIESDNTITAADNINLTIDTGCFISVVGRSGSGKSTLLKMMGGLLAPTSGKIIIDGQCITDLSDEEISKIKYSKIGFVFQDYFLEESFTVYQNLEIALMISNCDRKERKQIIQNVLAEVGLSDKENSLVSHLSGGEKQRVSIARAMVNNPDIIMADEPCGNLDSYNGEKIMKLLKKQNQLGKTIILITHNLEDASVADRIITMKDGAIIQDEDKRRV